MLTEDFAELFEGRKDACGTPNGGCLRIPSHDFRLVWAAHLNGSAPTGVYPMVERIPGSVRGLDPYEDGSHLVKWGCVDFDIKSEAHRSWDYETESEAHVASVNLVKVLKHLGATSWIERTRSCGRHVWLFASTWVPASTMRHALLTACKVAGVSSREINPKQTQLGDGQLGNYVRLPYPGALTDNVRSGSRQVMIGVDPLASFTLEYFLNKALPARTSPQTLEAIAAKWREPETQRSALEFDASTTGDLLTLVSRLTATGRSVFTNGPNDGDRSRGMVYLARQARLKGLTPSETLTLLRGAHWNKYRNRADEELQLRDIVERAWT